MKYIKEILNHYESYKRVSLGDSVAQELRDVKLELIDDEYYQLKVRFIAEVFFAPDVKQRDNYNRKVWTFSRVPYEIKSFEDLNRVNEFFKNTTVKESIRGSMCCPTGNLINELDKNLPDDIKTLVESRKVDYELELISCTPSYNDWSYNCSFELNFYEDKNSKE